MNKFITVSTGENEAVDININKILYIEGNRAYFSSSVTYTDGSMGLAYVELDDEGMEKLYTYLDWLDIEYEEE